MTPEEAYDLVMVALTIYREAAAEPYDGKRAVASVMRNRWEHPGWWGKTPAGVVTARLQFSAMTAPGDPNLVKWPKPEEQAWKDSLEIATCAVLGVLGDDTKGATHYLNPKSLAKLPEWARDADNPTMVDESKVTTRIGNHVFMKLA